MAYNSDAATAAEILEPLRDHWAIGPWLADGPSLIDVPDQQPSYHSLSTGERRIVDIALAVQTGRYDFPFIWILEVDQRWRERIITALATRAGVGLVLATETGA